MQFSTIYHYQICKCSDRCHYLRARHIRDAPDAAVLYSRPAIVIVPLGQYFALRDTVVVNPQSLIGSYNRFHVRR